MNEQILNYLIIPILIFIARIIDVSLGTIRVIYITKGYKYIAPLFAFCEISIWLLAIRQIMSNLNNPVTFIAYAAGYATGTLLGLIISEKMAIGNVIIRVITRRDAEDLVQHLKNQNFRITAIDGEGNNGDVKLIFMVVKSKQVPEIIDIIKDFNPKAFFSIEDIRKISDPFTNTNTASRNWFHNHLWLRKNSK